MQKRALGDDPANRVRRESQVRQGYSRLETVAQGALLFFLGGLLIALVVMSALVFGL